MVDDTMPEQFFLWTANTLRTQ